MFSSLLPSLVEGKKCQLRVASCCLGLSFFFVEWFQMRALSELSYFCFPGDKNSLQKR